MILKKIGAFMAQQLRDKKGASGLEQYASQGGIAFFQDYITLSKSGSAIPKELQFNEPFAALVTEMARDWNKSNTDYVRQFWLTPDADIEAVAKTLRQSFAGASVYPNLVDDFFNVTRQAAVLARHQLPRLAELDRPTGQVVRYQRQRPGELLHLRRRRRSTQRPVDQRALAV